MKKIILSGILLGSLALVGCGKEKEKNIIIGTPSRIKKLDPMVSNDIPSLLVTNQIFETFLYYENKELKSNVLDKYIFVNDTLELTPKKDLKFSNGDSVTIEDFKNSLERTLTHPGCKFLTGNIETIKINGDKVVITFKVATPSILNNMTYPMIVLLKETDKGLVGTGSFKLDKEDIDTIELSPNNYSKNPGKNKIIFRAIPEDNARTMALEAEEIQINTNVPPVDKKLVKSKGIEVIETPSVTTEMVWFNNEKLTLEERVKISKAINKGDLIATSLEGSGTIATSMIPETSYGFSPNTKEIEVEDVKINRTLKIILNDVGTRKTNAQIIQANLKEVGIESEIIILDWAKYLDSSAKGEHDLLLGGWVNGTFDAEGVLYPLFHSQNAPEAGRRTMYSNKEFDSLLESSRTYDLNKRVDYLKKSAEKLYEDYAILPLYYPNYSVGVANNVVGFKGDERGLYNFSQLNFKN